MAAEGTNTIPAREGEGLHPQKRSCGCGGDDLTMDLTSLAANHLFVPAVALAYAAPETKDHGPTFCIGSNANNYGDCVHERWHSRLPLNVPHDVQRQRATPSTQQQ